MNKTGPPTPTTPAQLHNALKKLSEITPRLNRITDAASSIFRAVENALDQAHVGIAAAETVKLLREESEIVAREESTYYVRVERYLLLVYERINGRMRLGFDEQTTRSTSSGDELTRERDGAIPWDQASRDRKIAGVVTLPALIEQIVAEASALLSAADTAMRDEHLSAMIASLDEDRPRRRRDENANHIE